MDNPLIMNKRKQADMIIFHFNSELCPFLYLKLHQSSTQHNHNHKRYKLKPDETQTT